MTTRQFWQQEAAKMRDKSAVLDTTVLSSPNNESELEPGIHLNLVGDITINTSKKGDKNPKVYLYDKNDVALLGQIGGTISVDLIYHNLLEQNIPIASIMRDPRIFKNYVQGGGLWDYKVRYKQSSRRDTIYGMINIFYQNNTKFSFNGKIMESQDIGNHHFGVMGKAAGFPTSTLFTEEVLLFFAGEAQIKAGTSKPEWQVYEIIENGDSVSSVMLPPYGDDPRDQSWIKSGFDYWKNRK